MSTIDVFIQNSWWKSNKQIPSFFMFMSKLNIEKYKENYIYFYFFRSHH